MRIRRRLLLLFANNMDTSLMMCEWRKNGTNNSSQKAIKDKVDTTEIQAKEGASIDTKPQRVIGKIGTNKWFMILNPTLYMGPNVWPPEQLLSNLLYQNRLSDYRSQKKSPQENWFLWGRIDREWRSNNGQPSFLRSETEAGGRFPAFFIGQSFIRGPIIQRRR